MDGNCLSGDTQKKKRQNFKFLMNEDYARKQQEILRNVGLEDSEEDTTHTTLHKSNIQFNKYLWIASCYGKLTELNPRPLACRKLELTSRSLTTELVTTQHAI